MCAACEAPREAGRPRTNRGGRVDDLGLDRAGRAAAGRANSAVATRRKHDAESAGEHFRLSSGAPRISVGGGRRAILTQYGCDTGASRGDVNMVLSATQSKK